MTYHYPIMDLFEERDVFAEVYTELTEGTAPERIRKIERAYSLSFIGRGTTRLAFRADTHTGGDPIIVKIALQGQGGVNAVKRETELWRTADAAQRNLLAPVIAADTQHRWLTMPVIDAGVDTTQAHEFHRKLVAAGLAIQDVTPGDIGVLDGERKLIDYANCQKIKQTSVTRTQMKEIVERRWEQWE
ncbi:MAG: hypothetical protein ABEI86_11360 [Halobacteriaceae archaeon]